MKMFFAPLPMVYIFLSLFVLQQGISEPLFYGDLVYKFKRIVGKPNFSDQFKNIVKRYIRSDITWISCDSLHALF